MSTCSHCNSSNPAFKCSSCKKVYYCSVECQKDDWKSHKCNCLKIVVCDKIHELLINDLQSFVLLSHFVNFTCLSRDYNRVYLHIDENGGHVSATFPSSEMSKHESIGNDIIHFIVVYKGVCSVFGWSVVDIRKCTSLSDGEQWPSSGTLKFDIDYSNGNILRIFLDGVLVIDNEKKNDVDHSLVNLMKCNVQQRKKEVLILQSGSDKDVTVNKNDILLTDENIKTIDDSQ